MSIECLLDNCPHHASQKVPLEICGTVCGLKVCAWDQPTMSLYLKAVIDGNSNPEEVLPTEGAETCNNSQEEST